MLRNAMRTGLFACALLAGAAAAHAETASPIQLSAGVVIDQWGNLEGGLKRGAVALASTQLGLEVDAERAFGWQGGALLVSGIYKDRSTISREFVGDLHGVDNRDGTGGVRLYEAWIRQAFSEGYGKLGLIDLNSEFSVNRTGALFVNGAHGIGLEMEQLGWTGPSIYPRPRAGIVGAMEGDASWKAGVFSGAAPPDGETRRRAMPLIGVLERSGPTVSGGQLTLGAWAHSASYGDTFAVASSRAAAGGYLLCEQPLWRGGERQLSGFARIGLADAKAEPIANDLNVGLVLTRPFRQRDGEAVGLALLSSGNSRRFRPALQNGDAPASRRETVVEASYRLPVGAGLLMQPDIQYVVHPGGVAGPRNALVIGLRLEGAWNAGL